MVPLPDYTPAFSVTLYSREGILMSGSVSKEEQWCLPIDHDIPDKLKQCLIYFEDEYFHYHPGINPVSMVKAAISNYKNKRIVRGGSTITMQVMRMKNKNVKRSFKNKTWESLAAIKYTFFKSKKKILKEWLEIAPYGGNIIGARAASLHYFGRELHNLSWSEYALLAVIPNAPSKVNLKKNRAKLKEKRDALLKKLYLNGKFSKEEFYLWSEEELPEKMHQIPQKAYHLMKFSATKTDSIIIHSTIRQEYQNRLGEILEKEARFLQSDGINQAAAVIIDVENNELLAYMGNVLSQEGKFRYVDIAQSPRSYGSLLKPFLYLNAIEKGIFLPFEMIADVPTVIGDYRPENFDKKFRGAVTMDEMVIESLNVPAVRILNKIGLEQFYDELSSLELRYLDRGAEYYGLSLILGGGETTLWDISRLYKGMAQNYLGKEMPFQEIKILREQNIRTNHKKFDPKSLEYVIEAMSDLERPREEKHWNLVNREGKIAWKTGTSYGHKDAWTVGFNSKYMVGVWVGNENGEGRYNLTGVSRAAPIMFKIFNQLENKWFKQLVKNENEVNICAFSGKMAGKLCKNLVKIDVPKISHRFEQCSYHEKIGLNDNNELIPEGCKLQPTKYDTIERLPGSMAYYFEKNNTLSNEKSYVTANLCLEKNEPQLEVIYPIDNFRLFLPKDKPNEKNEMIARAYHSDKTEDLFWFLNEVFLGITRNNSHEINIEPEKGKNILKIIDTRGNKKRVKFEVLETK